MKLIVIFLIGLIVLRSCTLQSEPQRDSDGLIDSDRWEHSSKEFDGTEQECLVEAKKDFKWACPQTYSPEVCNNIWEWTEVYTWIAEEDGLKYCTMTIPKDYHIEVI